jgi:hypothetical protein
MDNRERAEIFRQIGWDYNISPSEIEDVLMSEKKNAGHYDRERLFIKMLESYSWFTVIQLFAPEEINDLLTKQVVNKLRSPSLRKKYEFVRERLQHIIQTTG